MKRLWIGILIFALYLGLVFLGGTALRLPGGQYLLFSILLGLIGAGAIFAVYWYISRINADSAGAAPADSPDTVTLRGLFHDANARIRNSPKAGAKSLASMPLIYVVGGENSAKTQTVLQSGLEPELLAGGVFRDGVVAPTQLANLWLAGSYVLVEASGTLLHKPALWTRIVRSTLPARLGSAFSRDNRLPARAVVVCVSIERIMGPSTSEQIRQLAQTLNERLRELAQTMGISLPVYVLFTKMDTIVSFADYAAQLTQDEVKLPLGSLLAQVEAGSGLYADQAEAQVRGYFDRLIYTLSEFRLEVLSRGTDLKSLSRAYEFPRDLRKLRDGIVSFLVELGRPSQLGVNPFLRGFFFTGVRAHYVEDVVDIGAAQPVQQAGSEDPGATSIFSLGGRPAQPFQPPRQKVASTRKVPQWVFLSHLFARIFLADKSALEASRASLRTNILQRVLLAAASGLVLLLLVFVTISFFHNRSLERRVSEVAHASVVPVAAGDYASLRDLQTLDKLRVILLELESYRQDGAPLMYRWGLYKGDALYPVACRAYADKFSAALLTPVQRNMLNKLRAVPLLPQADANYNATYFPLKAYIVTTAHPEKSTLDFLPSALAAEWAGNNTPPDDVARMARTQFEFYATMIPAPGSCLAAAGGQPETAAVAHAQAYLGGFKGLEHIYQSMIAAANHKVPGLRYNDKFPGSARNIVDGYLVDGAFTKPGYSFMVDAIHHPEKYYRGEEWVLGPQLGTPDDPVKLTSDLQQRYETDYINAWRAYLTAARFQYFRDLPDAAARLSSLVSNDSPILELFSLISFNTGVESKAISMAFQAPQGVVPPTNPDNVFMAQSNQLYIQKLQDLGGAVKQVTDNPLIANDPTAATPIINSAIAAEQAVQSMSNGFVHDPAGNMDKTSFALLEAPIKSAEELAAQAPA
ncbi:MAG: ImcF-related family protein, partial [Terracidiphilus sp.]